jgi:hypothetical protein
MKYSVILVIFVLFAFIAYTAPTNEEIIAANKKQCSVVANSKWDDNRGCLVLRRDRWVSPYIRGDV